MKQIKHHEKKFMVAIDNRNQPVNFYIHRRCNDPEEVRKALENEEKASKVLNFEV
jgi:hypothetical protein